MPYELDFLPVGEGERSGDAIALRFGPVLKAGVQKVMVVDGGFRETGAGLVDHVQAYYDTDTVDLAVSTHPDGDHVGGLCTVVERLRVKELLLHRPWLHVEPQLAKKLRAELAAAVELEALATSRGVPIVEPFAGLTRFEDALTVVSPSLAFYEELIPQFRALETVGKSSAEILAAQFRRARAAAGVLVRVSETFHLETLTDEGETSAENNSSAVLHLQVDGRRILLTGDAGIPALEQAVDLMSSWGLSTQPVRFIQVPHHGSKRNVGPSVLDRLLGPIGYYPAGTFCAYVSAAKDGAPKHPSQRVVNAFTRREANVYVTRGNTICHSHGAPHRWNWTPLVAEPLDQEFEDD